MAYQLSIAGLDFGYGAQIVFSNFCLSTNSRVVGLSGPPGCGKTTLLKILARHLNPARTTIFEVPARPVLLLQEDALLPWLTGWQNLELAGLNSRSQVRSHPLFEAVENLLNKRAHAMSFGQRRTIELFRAFVFKAGILCLDEPFNFIDFNTRRVYLDYLAQGHVERLVVMSSHHVDELVGVGADILRFSGSLPVGSLERASL